MATTGRRWECLCSSSLVEEEKCGNSLCCACVVTGGPRFPQLAAVTPERWYMAPGVRTTHVHHNGVIGTLFLPPGELCSLCSGRNESAASSERWFPAGPGPFPAMLDLWGMGGGLVEYRAALLASRGYASLSLAYKGHKELPAPHNRMMVGHSYFKVKYATSFLQNLFSRFLFLFFYLFLDKRHSTYFRIILKSVLTKLGSSVSSLGANLTLGTAVQPNINVCRNPCVNPLFLPYLCWGKHLLQKKQFY